MGAAIVGTSIAATAVRHQHRSAVDVRVLDGMRAEAAHVAQVMFPGALKRVNAVPGLHQTSISRSRAGDATNPLYRLGLWMVALRVSGAPSERAALAVEYLQELVMRLWPPADLDEGALHRREQELNGEENVWQLRCVLGEKGARAHYVEVMREYIAVAGQLVAAIEAHGMEVRA